jgi:hypothetical protein
MLGKSVLVSVVATAVASLLLGTAHADDSLPNLAGSYRCEPQPAPCRSGQAFTVTQNGIRSSSRVTTGSSVKPS